jgi:hypothetical protein
VVPILRQQLPSGSNSRMIIAYQWTQLPIGEVPVNITDANTPTPTCSDGVA